MISCRLCSSPLRTVLELPPTPPANALIDKDEIVEGWNRLESWVSEPSFPLALAQCTQCRHVQLGHEQPADLFREAYPYESGTSPVFREHLHRLARSVQANLFPGDLIVEIGSNDGTLLSFFDPHFRTLGVDPAGALAKKATAAGNLTYPGPFNVETARAIRRATGPAKVVLGLNVFAHIEDMRGVFDAVRLMLGDDGEVILEVAYLPVMLRLGAVEFCYHEHVSYHHLSALVPFLARHGMYLHDAELVDSQGGSLRCYAASKPKRQSNRLADLLAAETESVSDAAVERFKATAEEKRRELRELLAGFKAQGKTIAGFGCTARSTTLLHWLDIGRETIDYLVEENPRKVGKFSPGKHIPIVSVAHFREHPPDCCVIFAWNFEQNIRNRHDWFVEGGGKWILPMPSVEVVE